MKTTPWFPGDVKPARVGVYQREIVSGSLVYSHWNGYGWGAHGASPLIARRLAGIESLYQALQWRGLATPPTNTTEGPTA